MLTLPSPAIFFMGHLKIAQDAKDIQEKSASQCVRVCDHLALPHKSVSVGVPKHVLLQGRREDLKTIWDRLLIDPSAQWTLSDSSDVAPFTRRGTDENREKEWRRLEELLDLNEEQINP